MIKRTSRYVSAWVPEDLDDWDSGEALAVEWVQHEADRLGGVRPVLVLNTLDDYAKDGPIAAFARRGVKSTTKSAHVPSGAAPVLAYTPHADTLVHAITKTKNMPLCVVETSSFPVHGWASAVGAVNLATGEVTPPPAPDLERLLDRLVIAGNNAFGDQFGKRSAATILKDLAGHDGWDVPYLMGYLLARGRTTRSIENLAKIAK